MLSINDSLCKDGMKDCYVTLIILVLLQVQLTKSVRMPSV